MTRIYKKTINNCDECPHYNHSGAFTKGGAIPLCRHPLTKAKWLKYNGAYLPFTWADGRNTDKKHREATYEIPDWCPLGKL